MYDIIYNADLQINANTIGLILFLNYSISDFFMHYAALLVAWQERTCLITELTSWLITIIISKSDHHPYILDEEEEVRN